MDYDKINASIVIQNGEIIVNGMFNNEIKILDQNSQLLILREITVKSLMTFEKNWQQQYRPNEDTVYTLPKDE